MSVIFYWKDIYISYTGTLMLLVNCFFFDMRIDKTDMRIDKDKDKTGTEDAPYLYDSGCQLNQYPWCLGNAFYSAYEQWINKIIKQARIQYHSEEFHKVLHWDGGDCFCTVLSLILFKAGSLSQGLLNEAPFYNFQ